ncbi:hypothetical protein NDU88_006463 [Pleurodeles waltl]|uniref:Uncharacterized protein n=1 Tax=Pleurodeles waltl TaxID=8319 RepID=A0AAV7MF18_PLEWA|nr:hypothetical protein NDU88_006463 [Pleurodeles waltl]
MRGGCSPDAQFPVTSGPDDDLLPNPQRSVPTQERDWLRNHCGPAGRGRGKRQRPEAMWSLDIQKSRPESPGRPSDTVILRYGDTDVWHEDNGVCSAQLHGSEEDHEEDMCEQ